MKFNYYCRKTDVSTTFSVDHGTFELVLFKEIFNHSCPIAFHFYSFDLDYFIKESKGKLLPRIIKESSPTTAKFIVFPRNHRFFQSFDKKIQQIVAAGIINHLGNDYKESINPKHYSHLTLEEVEPLSMEHLKAGFVVWLIALIFPIVAFIFERIFTFGVTIIFDQTFETYIETIGTNVRKRNRKMQKSLRKLEQRKSKADEQKLKVIAGIENESIKKSLVEVMKLSTENETSQNDVIDDAVESLFYETMRIHH